MFILVKNDIIIKIVISLIEKAKKILGEKMSGCKVILDITAYFSQYTIKVCKPNYGTHTLSSILVLCLSFVFIQNLKESLSSLIPIIT